jgi:hypothetical protein
MVTSEAPDTSTLVAALGDPAVWTDAAGALVAELGFRLVGEGIDPPDDGHLVVALREAPTLRHFDPESITFYGPKGDGAGVVTVGRLQPGELLEHRVLWGHVHVTDRIPVENRYLTFGGQLRMAGLPGGLTLAYLRSPAPIVRWGGHSQGTDSLAGAIGAFFGRLIVPVNFTAGAAARIDALDPGVIFTAFLRDEVRRRTSSSRLRGDPSELDRHLAAAWARWRVHEPARAGAEALLADLHL